MNKSKKEWKWPLGIFIGYSIFVIGTVSFVVFTFTQSRDLVVDDYYAQTLVFDEHMERVNLAKNLEDGLSWEISDENLVFRFPEEHVNVGVSGNIHLYRPSNAKLDQNVSIAANEDGTQIIPINNLDKGLWKVKVNWESDNLRFYKESDMFLR